MLSLLSISVGQMKELFLDFSLHVYIVILCLHAHMQDTEHHLFAVLLQLANIICMYITIKDGAWSGQITSDCTHYI